MISTPRATRHLLLPVHSRERSHRRAIVLGVTAVVFLVAGPLLVEHAIGGLPMESGVRDHLGWLCLIALQPFLSPVHHVFHALLAGGLAYAAWDRLRAWLKLRAVLGPIEAFSIRACPGDPFWSAAREAGVEPESLRIVAGLPDPAFTVGWLRPRIFVAHELATCLPPAELVAVLAHEGSHAARRDPLRFSALRFLSCVLFWLPAVKRLAEDAVEDAEVRADDDAARGRPLILASAILRLAVWPRSPRLAGMTAGFGGRELLDRRVRRLAGADAPVRSRVTRRSLVWAAPAVMLLWASSAAVAHPVQSAPKPSHCDHPHGAAFMHLFCDRSPGVPGLHGCPRATPSSASLTPV